jgi:hypothetical protein
MLQKIALGERAGIELNGPLFEGKVGKGREFFFGDVVFAKGFGNGADVEKFANALRQSRRARMEVGVGIVTIGVEADDVGEHQADGQAVGDVEFGGEGIGGGVGGAEHGVFDRTAGQVRAQKHFGAGFIIVGIGDGLLVRRIEELPGLLGQASRGFVALGAGGGFDGVGDGVDAGGGGDFGRLGGGERGIENRQAREGFGIAAGHFYVRWGSEISAYDCASEPVPAVVGTAIMGSIGLVAFCVP